MTNKDFEEQILDIEEELRKAGIPNKELSDMDEVFKTLRQLEEAGIIKRKGYDLAPPYERRYFPNQEPQQPYFSM